MSSRTLFCFAHMNPQRLIYACGVGVRCSRNGTTRGALISAQTYWPVVRCPATASRPSTRSHWILTARVILRLLSHTRASVSVPVDCAQDAKEVQGFSGLKPADKKTVEALVKATAGAAKTVPSSSPRHHLSQMHTYLCVFACQHANTQTHTRSVVCFGVPSADVPNACVRVLRANMPTRARARARSIVCFAYKR